jgi:hypothetical protein
MALLRADGSLDLAVTSARIRAFALDRATCRRTAVLYRAVGWDG